ncbi:MAG: hypothetical protein R3284_10675 [Rubricoccaceae bacterium]|nr:hypothetical protein [Rubricoccaceae bacterium]
MSESQVHTEEAHESAAEIEGEGVSAPQIFGIMLFTVVAIAIAVFVAYFFWFVPTRDRAANVAEDVPSDRYVDRRELAAEAEDLLSHYALIPDSEGRYRIPIDAAMRLMEADTTGSAAASMPESRVGYNLSWLILDAPSATVNLASTPPTTNIEEPADAESDPDGGVEAERASTSEEPASEEAEADTQL